MSTPVIDKKLEELQTRLSAAIADHNRPLKELLRGAILELMTRREQILESQQ